MKLYQKADGGVLSSAREYDIAQTTDIKEGALVKIVAGLVVACDGTSRCAQPEKRRNEDPGA